MTISSPSVQDFSQLQDFVHRTLSNIESLDPRSFQLTRSLLVKNGRPCGVYFCLNGPRSVRLTAIWETEGNSVIFYGSRGERVMCAKLDSAVALDVKAAA